MLRPMFWCVFGLTIQLSISSNTYLEQETENCQDDSPNFLYNPSNWNIFRKRINKLVFGGNKAKIEQYPHQVSLYYKNFFVCGGSIISDRYILTAAHCLDNTEPDPRKWKVGTGSSYLSEDDVTYCVAGYIRHPRYNEITVDYDLAILQTSKPMDLNGNTTRAVRLASAGKLLVPGDSVIVTGYGSQTGLDEPSLQLRAVKLPVVGSEYCKHAWLFTYGLSVTPRMFCAGYPEGGKSGCYRDSGGPVVSADSLVQYGIVSFGPEGCNERGIPNVFTNIAVVRVWITEITGI